MFKSLDEIKAAHTGYWFDVDTLAFFDSRIEEKVYPTSAGTYFVSSEKGPSGRRLYSVRFASLDGDIRTVGDFQAFRSSREAHESAELSRFMS